MKKVLTLGMVILMLCAIVLPVYAAGNEITPYYNNTMRVTGRFQIESTGEAVITLSFTGYSSCATDATLTSKIQKSTTSGWVDVDGASWVDEVDAPRGTLQHRYQLTSTGTYRLVYEVVVRGTCGEPDVISQTIEDEYI